MLILKPSKESGGSGIKVASHEATENGRHEGMLGETGSEKSHHFKIGALCIVSLNWNVLGLKICLLNYNPKQLCSISGNLTASCSNKPHFIVSVLQGQRWGRLRKMVASLQPRVSLEGRRGRQCYHLGIYTHTLGSCTTSAGRIEKSTWKLQ